MHRNAIGMVQMMEMATGLDRSPQQRGHLAYLKQISPVQWVDKQLEGGHARMLAVKLPSCVSVAVPPGSQSAAGDGLTPELQAAYVLL